MRKFVILFYLFGFMLVSTNMNAMPNDPIDDQTTVVEIVDKYNEVRLGITDKYIYMTFSEGVRELANRDFENQYRVASQAFSDSEGNFIIGDIQFLSSNSIEIPLSDIETIEFTNGNLTFSYHKEAEIGFEEVQSYNGMMALQNFYVEDLEKFVLAYQKQQS